jgi:hypothetical protein
VRVRKAIISGVPVDPSALALLAIERAVGEAPFELELTLADLRASFFRTYAEWLADMREYPDPDDEVERRLRGLGWPSLGALVEVDPALAAVVLLVLGRELLADLEEGRDPLAPVRWVPRSVEEIELRGRRIVLRGPALALPPRLAGAGRPAPIATG